MKMGDVVVLIASFILMIRLSIQINTNICSDECTCLNLFVDCSKRNLDFIPKIPMWVETLDLSNNRLHDAALQHADAYDHLKVMKLDKNRLSSIPDVRKYGQLQEITISKNDITFINTGCFEANSSIKLLNLNKNHIANISEKAFTNLSNLETLKLNYNDIKSLPNQLFINQIQLKTLELNHNRLSVLQGMTFQGLEHLTTLKIKRNVIIDIMAGAFFGFKTIEVLELDHNRIQTTSKGWMYGLETLLTLSMSHNIISDIGADSWEQCKKLEILDLSHNRLTNIDGRSLQHLTKLKKLNLGGNYIMSISQEAFSTTNNLEELLLNNNKISWTIEDMAGAFAKLQSLKRFSLAANHINSINSKAFDGLSNVLELDLNGNNITSIQQYAFDSMVNLKKLHLNSTSLSCDCNLLWLVKWAKEKLDQHLITGKCAYPLEVKGKVIINIKEENCGDSPRPKIVQHPKPHLAIKGKPTSLSCSATSNPYSNMTFQWRRNSVNISHPMVYENVTSMLTGQYIATSILTIPNITHSDSGKYQCMVLNDFGTTYSDKVKITIGTFPRFTQQPSNVTVKTGETVTLNCAATGDPIPEISWKKDGGNDFPAARERRMNVMPTDHLFFIVNAKTTDMGVYSCAAKNQAGAIMANATLTVLEEPSFVKIMENREVTIGGSVVLECMTLGFPKPKLKWIKDGTAIAHTERHYFLDNDQLLIIVGTEASDAGKYECEITNRLGTKRAMTELNVLPPVAIMVNEKDMTGIIIITVVCSAVGTSIIWVVIIYHTRRRMASAVPPFPAESVKMTQIVHSDSDSPQLFPDNVSEHSSCKDSGTGDSAKQTSFDGVPVERTEAVHFDSLVGRSYSPVPEAHKLLPSSFKPTVKVCVNKSSNPPTYSFSSQISNG